MSSIISCHQPALLTKMSFEQSSKRINIACSNPSKLVSSPVRFDSSAEGRKIQWTGTGFLLLLVSVEIFSFPTHLKITRPKELNQMPSVASRERPTFLPILPVPSRHQNSSQLDLRLLPRPSLQSRQRSNVTPCRGRESTGLEIGAGRCEQRNFFL